jgi:hypothetical protein
MSQESRQSILLLYLGVRKDSKGKRKTAWYKIEPKENNGDPLHHITEREHHYTGRGANLNAPVVPGSIISIEASPDEKSVFPSTSRLVAAWKNEDDVVRWRSQSRAIEGEIEETQRATREARRDLPAKNLAPFREAYLRLNRRQQSHLLAWVIQQITS